MKSLFIVLVILMLGTVACSNDDAVNALQQEVDAMKQEIKTLETDHAKQVSANANKITALEADNIRLKSSLISIENRPNLAECLTEFFRAEQDGNIVENPYLYISSAHHDGDWLTGSDVFQRHGHTVWNNRGFDNAYLSNFAKELPDECK